jgi:ADP-ribose pyrophosphatase YjhB (NUDIX family)
VYGLAIRDHQILLTRISDLVPGGVGKWTLPGGGMDWGETPDETLRREMIEETGLSPAIGPIFDIHAVDATEGATQWHLLRAVYRVEVEPHEPRVTETGGSVDLAAWQSLDDLGRLPLVRLVRRTLELL